jgi:hypothetical protein
VSLAACVKAPYPGAENLKCQAPVLSRTGIGVALDINLSDALALETRATGFADDPFRGRVNAAAGMKATLVRRTSMALYGVALPGMYRAKLFRRIDADPTLPGASVRAVGTVSQFALQLGAGFLFGPLKPFSMRVELDRLIYAVPGALPRDLAGAEPDSQKLGNGWDLNLSVTYRAGPRLRPVPQHAPTGHWTVGAQTGVTVATGPVALGVVGAFASRRLSKYCDFDGSVSASVANAIVSVDREGGGLVQGVAGVKLGVRTGRLGVFFKARAGAHQYSRGLNLHGDWAAGEWYRRVTVAALDIGGVVEADLSTRTFLRIDIGESLSLFPASVPRTSYEPAASADQFYTVPLRVGVGRRF